MQTIGQAINYKKFQQFQGVIHNRPINTVWEEADEYSRYTGINSTPFVLKMFKEYGKSRVLNLRSFLADAGADKNKGGKIALLRWRLNQR